MNLPWFARLDEWQHAHAPSFGPLFWLWTMAWTPLCNYTDRYYLRGT